MPEQISRGAPPGTGGRHWLAMLAGMLLAASTPTSAQSLSRVSLDSVGAIDLFKGQGTTGNPDASVDISTVIRVGGGWSVHIRPWFFKSSSLDSQWSKEIYQAAARYERAGEVALRLDAGYIALPIGLGILDMRADINPTIQPHLSYYVPMLPFDRNAPTVGAIAASYPLGANLTISSSRWDLRGALIGSSPARRYVLNASATNPALTPVGVVGGGIVPRPGLRFGASFASGRYATDSELKVSDGNPRTLQTWSAEAEYAVKYTKLSAEYTQEHFRYGATRDRASTWFVQGVQTLSARWFVAARRETISAPPFAFGAPNGPRLSFYTAEASVGYRVTPEVTLRGSVTSSRWYLAPEADQRVGMQMVWSRRWW